jgi:hypothetical protein
MSLFSINRVSSLSLLVFITTSLFAQTNQKYEFYGFVPGMSYLQAKASVQARKLIVLADNADSMVMQMPEPLAPGRPVWVTLYFNDDDKVAEVRVQELGSNIDHELMALATKRWGEPIGVRINAIRVDQFWGNKAGLHVEHDTEEHNLYIGCTCIRVLDPSLSSATHPGIPRGARVSLDIMGIALGQDFTTAVQGLKQKGFSLNVVRFDTAERTGAVATKRNQAQQVSESFLVEAVNGQINRVRHNVLYPMGQQPDLTQTLDALRSKYGRASQQVSPGLGLDSSARYYDLTWLYAADGRAKTGVSCPNNGRETITSFGLLDVPFDPPCFRGASAHVVFVGDTVTVSELSVDIHDTASQVVLMEHHQKNDQEQKRRDAGGGAPIL